MVLIIIVTISTFAWYTLGTTGSVKTSSGNDSITTATPSARAVALPLSVSVTDVSTIEMVTYKSTWPANLTSVGASEKATRLAADPEDVGAGWYHAYYDGSKNVYQAASLGGGAASYLAITVTIKAQADAYEDEDGKSWDNNAIATALDGQAVDVVVTQTSVGGKTNRAMFFGASTSSAVTGLPANMTGVDTDGSYNVATNLSLANLKTAQSGTVCYFGIFVEGEKGSSGEDTANTIIGDFTVTVSAHS